MSSAAEVQSHLYVALDQGYIGRDRFDEMYKQADKTARIIKQTRSPKETRPTKQT